MRALLAIHGLYTNFDYVQDYLVEIFPIYIRRASELGILSTYNPRLVTSFFSREVPRGTNGGMSVLGTLASGLGGLFIGLVFYIMSFTLPATSLSADAATGQAPIVVLGLVSGVLGSLYDSILGATLQASYYSVERKCIVKSSTSVESGRDESIKLICGMNILSNDAVNFISIALTMATIWYIAPYIFCSMDSNHCTA